MKRLFQISTVAMALMFATSAPAQVVHMVPAGVGGVANGGIVGGIARESAGLSGFNFWNGWGNNPWFGYHASTPYEGFQRGNAAVIQAWGVYEYLNAEANKTNQDAFEHFLQNDRMRVEVYFAKKQIWDSWRATQRGSRPTPAQLARWADQLRPDRMAAAQLDQATGTLTWPVVLTGEEFAEPRARLQTLFAERAKGQVDPTFVAQVKEAISTMRATLLSQIDAMPSMQYIAADKFLDSLHYESYFVRDAVAMN